MSNLTDRLGGARASLAFKAPCRVATTANITLSGFQTIDGIAMTSSDADNGLNIRVLVKSQTTASENGIYEAATGAWARAKDMDGSLDIVCGSRVYVAGGSTASGGYVITTADPITIGTTSLTFASQASVDISFGSLVELTVPDPAADLIPIVDASTAALKNIKPQTLAKYNSDGTAALPAIAFASDLTKGIYSAGSNLLGFAIAGVGEAILSSTAFYPVTSDGNALGTSSQMWSDLFLASGGVINWNAGDVTITHATDTLTFGGAASGYQFDALIAPSSSDGAPLGSTSLMWSDLFLALGSVINWNNGDVTLTHAANTLTFGGATSGYQFDAIVAPSSSDGAPLGSTSLMWSDLFLASGAVINFNNGDVTVTHSLNTLAFAGASSGYTFDSLITVTSANANALAVGANGTTNPVLQIDASATTVATGLAITGKAAASRLLIAVLSSGTDEGLSIDAKGAGTIRLGATSTGAVEFSRNAVPTASDGAALGTSSLMWSDAFFASGAVINFNAGDVTITHASNNLLFAGASSGYTFDAILYPTSNDGAALGDATHNFSDLFLASGAVINFNAGNYTLTHSAGALTAAGGPFTAPSFIPSSSSVPSNGLYLPAANTLGWGINSLAKMQLTSAALSPAVSDGAALGTASLMWSDAFFASGAVLNFNNGDVTITHAADTLTFAGAASGFLFASPVDIQTTFSLSGMTSDTIAGDQNDYNPSGLIGTITTIRIDGGASSRNITGLVAQASGAIKIILNVGTSNNLVLKDSTTSTAANQFKLGGDMTLTPSQGATLLYDGTSSRWRCIGTFTTAGGGSGTVTSVSQGFGMNFATITTSGPVALNAGYSSAIMGAA